MIKSIEFKNYRVLRDTTLPLGPFTVLVGPNGSGKSTVLHALRELRGAVVSDPSARAAVASVHKPDDDTSVLLNVERGGAREQIEYCWRAAHTWGSFAEWSADKLEILRRIRSYTLDESSIAAPVILGPAMRLREDGGSLAGVLDRMRDEKPEEFEKLNREVGALLPEFDRILFVTPAQGQRAFLLRTRDGRRAIPAASLSQGTLLALAILTLAYTDETPSLVAIEEPDRGIHPRLYREIRDALYRLAYPESFGLDREPVQVLITTHSPYLLDLHRDHPEEIVIAEKVGSEGKFHRLVDRDDLAELLEEASLGEIWYSGILGGVPAGT